MNKPTPLGPYRFRCMYENCRTTALENHAVCQLHFNFEVACSIILAIGSFALIAAFLYRFH